MNCKFCNAQFSDDQTLCPVCGRENGEETPEVAAEATEEVTEILEGETQQETMEETQAPVEESTENAPKRKPRVWVTILAVIGVLAIAAVLGIAIYYGVNAAKAPKSYTVSDEKADHVRNTVVATVGDMELTNSELQVCYWQAVNEFYNYYGYYLDKSMLDISQPLDTQFYNEDEGITWQQHFLESALGTWSRYAALNMMGKEEGFVLSEEAQAYLDSVPEQLNTMAVSYGYASAAEMLSKDMSAVCDTEGYLRFLNTNFYAVQYMDSRYEEIMPTAEEIDAYYRENQATLNEQGITNDGSITTDVRHILICPKGGTQDEDGVTYSEEEWEQCRLEAQKLLDQWQADSGTEEDFAELAQQYTEDPGSASTGGLYSGIRLGDMVEPFEQWCFDESRQYGDTGLVRTDFGYHIMFFVGSEEIWYANVRDTMLTERSLAITEEAAAKWPLETNYKKIALGEPQRDTTE